MIAFNEAINWIAFTLQREPWLIALVPMALALLVLISLEVRKKWISSAPPGSGSTSSPLEEAAQEGLCIIQEPGLKIHGGKIEPPGPVKAAPASRPKNKPYLIEVVEITDGLYKHERIRSDKLEFTHGSYEVDKASLFGKKPGLLEKQIMRIQGLESKWLIVFRAGEPKAVRVPVARVDPMVLARVRTARILSRAMKEIFSTALMDRKGVIFLFIVFGVIAVIVLKVQGYI